MYAQSRGRQPLWMVGAALLALAAAAVGATIEVIYSEITSSPTSIVPGARDANGNPVLAYFITLDELAMRPDGGEWIIKARSNLPTTLDAILILGSGTVGNAFCQDGQPVQGGLPGELYDFFDSPVPAAWNDAGRIAFSFRARGGSTAIYEKVVIYDPATQVHTIVVQSSDPALGLIDVPANPTGDERIGNSINSVHLLNDGRVGFVNTPIQNCHSTRYPAFFYDHTAFRQCGVSLIEGEVWDDMDYDDCGGSPDGHWFIKGDTERPDTTTDNILAVDDQVVLRENNPVAGSSVIMRNIIFTRMLPGGIWFCRGDDPQGNDWAVRNGVLLAKTGDAITEELHWGNAFSAFTGNSRGDWLLAGNTDATDPQRDYVLVLNGTEVIATEGDPVDLNGNGEQDDDAYIASFQPNDLFITDTRTVWFLATLRDGAGTALGDAFLRLQLPPPYQPGDMNCDGMVTFADIDWFVEALQGQSAWTHDPCPWLNADCNGDGDVTFGDIDPFVALIGTTY